MNCPSCNAALVIAERQNIEIDYCPQCRGVWLDRGELDKIIDRSTPSSTSPGPTEYTSERIYEGDAGSYRHKPYKKKRESFLGELFDF